jgi:uncharacterized OB-fold protein
VSTATPRSPAALPPQPLPDPDTEGFWRATVAGELRLARCTSCRRWTMPPLERCRACAAEIDWEPVVGTGTVYSFVVVRHAAVPGFTVPYVVALIELDDQPGLRLASRIVGSVPEDVTIGMRVRAEVVEHPGGEFCVPVFRAERLEPKEMISPCR